MKQEQNYHFNHDSWEWQINVVPVIIAYDKKDPSRNLCMPEEEFEYKGKIISYEHPEGYNLYYIKIK
ncbi:MAG: hypothetical protein KAH25_06755 [Bacteroidales bacterium]|nr:hypothetical protein [Bacteroidales bacterium]